MIRRFVPAVLAAVLATGCNRNEPAAEPTPSASATVQVPVPAEPTAAASVEPALAPSAQSSATSAAATPSAGVSLDTGALAGRRDPERLLRYYAAALAAREWAAAARAWGPGSGVTAATLKAAYDRAEPPVLTVGKGEQDAGAGSLYYEAPVTLRFGAAAAERGSLMLRRVNDVDGATGEQLRWHIERSTIGAGR